jgi:peptidoglycan/xylan/chitin deacetylase (PgdA/CDA1 family)
MQPKLFLIFTLLTLVFVSTYSQKTKIAKWQDDKAAAISLTFDDGSPNQFSVAMPMLDKLNIPATFFIITGEVQGSEYHGKFLGRPVADIIRGTADTPTNKDNFFERASAVAFLGYKGTLPYHTNAGNLYEDGKFDQAYKLIDTVYMKVRAGEFQPATGDRDGSLTWDAIRKYAARGHEFSSHTVTHPKLAVLDEPNMLYELEKSKEELKNKLGERYTFSAEGPYGTEDERAMSYAYKIYPALRNRMPEPFLGELNRASKIQPVTITDKEYVQWQRGATTKTPLALMKSWVDTVVAHNNNWLVLVFHGVDGKGWEALPGSLLNEYFLYIKKNENKAWIATFGDVAKYMKERMSSTVDANMNGDKISVSLKHSLDKLYDLPVTMKTYVPAKWKSVTLKQGGNTKNLTVKNDSSGSYVMYRLEPNKEGAELSGK